MSTLTLDRDLLDDGKVRPRPDLISLLTMLALSAFGVLMIYTASRHRLALEGVDPASTMKKQLLFVAIGLIVYLLASYIDYREYRHYASYIFLGMVILLLGVLFAEPTQGASRWIPIGPFQFQPSEFAKLAIILVLATLLAPARREGMTWQRVGAAVAITAIPAFLIYRQPDVGTMLVFGFIVGIMLFAAGATLRQLLVLVAGATVGIVAVVRLGLLERYQVERLSSFLNPEADALGSGYNLLQSETAIGSGRIFGNGLFSGTQTNLSFIPSQPTDFIFTAVGEQLGFVGAIVVLAAFAILMWRLFRAAAASRDRYGSLVCIGVAGMLMFHVFVNIGMTVRIMPVTGLPLPLLSSGGSFYLTVAFALGVANSVLMRRSPVPGETYIL
ncbi:MAG: rod shape-determining protein RodA [Acidimicrobiia bacterium]